MITVISLFILIVFALAMSLVARSIGIQRKIVIHLREQHKDIYKELQSPREVPFFMISKGSLDRFIFSKKYLDLGDSSLSELCKKQEALERALVLFLLAAIIVVVISVVFFNTERI